MLHFAYSFTDGQYEEYSLNNTSSLPVQTCAGGQAETGEIVDLSCMPFLYTPENQYSVTAVFDVFQSPVLGNLTTSLTWAWTDETYTSATTLPEDEPGAWLDDRGLLNGSINWENIFNSRFHLQIFGTNLMDKEYIMGNQNVWSTLGYRTVTYGEPRMYGVKLSFQWDA